MGFIICMIFFIWVMYVTFPMDEIEKEDFYWFRQKLYKRIKGLFK